MFHQIVVHLVIFISFTIDLFNNRSQTLVFAGSITSSKFNGSINVTQFESTSSISIILGFLFFSHTEKARHKLIIIF